MEHAIDGVSVYDTLYGPFFMGFLGMGDLFKKDRIDKIKKRVSKEGGETAALLWARATRIKSRHSFLSIFCLWVDYILVQPSESDHTLAHSHWKRSHDNGELGLMK